MKAPGSGILEFDLRPLEGGRTQLTITAYWHPRGVWGLLYWYTLVPAHLFLFRGWTRTIARRAEQGILPPPDPYYLPAGESLSGGTEKGRSS